MAGEGQDLDRNEPATPHKIDKARDRGSIFRSSEIAFAFILLACVACVYGLGLRVVHGTAALLQGGLSFAGRDELNASSTLAYVHALGTHALMTIAPLVFVIWTTALVINALQGQGVFSAEPLKPDFSRLSPATGLKRLFSMKSLHELWRSSAKIVVLALAMTLWARYHLLEILHIGSRREPMTERGIELLASALSLLAAVVLVFALLDWGLNRWQFMREMRMSRREMKDEHKEREGDPRIRARLRELRVEWFKRARQMAKVRSADVLVTNPTHYAIALEYRHGQMPAPMITARGRGDMAQRMRAEARRRAVPVVENPPLARALFALRESQAFVPEEHFDAVARILRWVYAARGEKTAARGRKSIRGQKSGAGTHESDARGVS
jgi:flagellar biosynthetic protein FlhB